MTERTRNIAVGLTALVALSGVGYMILLFGHTPAFARTGYHISIEMPGAGAIDDGSDVRLNGIRIGTVTEVALQDDPRMGVTLRCRIQRGTQIPADAQATIGRHGLGGGGYVQLIASIPEVPTPPTWVPTDGSGTLQGSRRGGGLLGPEFATQLDAIAEGFRAFSRLADDLNRVLGTPDSAEPVEGLAGTIQRLNLVLDNVCGIVGDPENQTNLSAALRNFRQATEAGINAMDELTQFARGAQESLHGVDRSTSAMTDAAQAAHKRMDDVAAKLIQDADRLGRLLTTLNTAAAKLNEDSSSAGKFLNDPALYNNLLESVEALTKTLAELDATVKLWRSQGIRLRLR